MGSVRELMEPFMILTEPVAETKVSPFIFRSYFMEKVCGKECSNLVLKRMLKKQELEDFDVLILKGLLDYGYLGGYMLRNYISYVEDNSELISTEGFRERIKVLVKKGLISQIEFVRNVGGKRVGSAFVYMLSESGLRFLKMINPSLEGKRLPELALEPMLNTLVVNQFVIMLQRQYGRCIAGTYFGEDIENSSGAQAVIDLLLPEKKQLRVFVFAVRDSIHYKNYFLKRLRAISSYMGRECEYTVFVICESEKQAMDCARYKGCDNQLVDMDVFYMTDTAGVSENVLGRLVDVSPQQDYSVRNIFRLDI